MISNNFQGSDSVLVPGIIKWVNGVIIIYILVILNAVVLLQLFGMGLSVLYMDICNTSRFPRQVSGGFLWSESATYCYRCPRRPIHDLHWNPPIFSCRSYMFKPIFCGNSWIPIDERQRGRRVIHVERIPESMVYCQATKDNQAMGCGVGTNRYWREHVVVRQLQEELGGCDGKK